MSICEVTSSISSSPPFTWMRKHPSPILLMVDIRFLSESKGTSSTRGNCCSSMSLFFFIPSATSTIAVSVGSPDVSCLPSASILRWASVHKSAVCKRRFTLLSSSPAGGSLRKSIRLPPLHPSTTVILFCVSVPVLSEQITVVLPSVSTDGRVRTMAFNFTRRCTPIASTIVDTICSPSGIAATARLTAIINTSSQSFPYNNPTRKIKAQIPSATYPNTLPNCSSRLPMGVSVACVFCSIWAILPTSVRIPVAITTPLPRP